MLSAHPFRRDGGKVRDDRSSFLYSVFNEDEEVLGVRVLTQDQPKMIAMSKGRVTGPDSDDRVTPITRHIHVRHIPYGTSRRGARERKRRFAPRV